MHTRDEMRLCPQGRAFVDRLGLGFELDNLPRIAGQILGLLLLSPDARSLEDIAELLRVSKASASSNARLLERSGLVNRTSMPGDRRDYYCVAEDAEERIVERRIRWLAETRDAMAFGLGTPAATHPAIRARLRTAMEVLGDAMEALEARVTKRRAGAGVKDHEETGRMTPDGVTI